jgi:plasmid stabilization system protein ParE
VIYEVRLREEADRDLASAALWYELHVSGLGHDFLGGVVQTLRSIAEGPVKYPIVWRETRRALMNRFPFGIYFRIERDAVVVVGIMHGSRHPRNWQKRQ